MVDLWDISQVYPSQTKILEGGTKEEIRIFEALFKGVSTRFGLRIVEKSIENLDFICCQSFQNLRLGSIKFRIATGGSYSKNARLATAWLVCSAWPRNHTMHHACSTPPQLLDNLHPLGEHVVKIIRLYEG
jgi:hypothetical protein